MGMKNNTRSHAHVEVGSLRSIKIRAIARNIFKKRVAVTEKLIN